MHSIVLKFGTYIIGHHWKKAIDFGECRMYSFFTGIQKRILILYGLWNQILQEVLVSKGITWLNSNLVCILCITSLHFVSILANLRLIVFLQKRKKISYILQSKESNDQNYASVQTVLSIKLKFDMYIVDPHSSYYINFGVSRRCSFLQDAKNVIYYALQVQNI